MLNKDDRQNLEKQLIEYALRSNDDFIYLKSFGIDQNTFIIEIHQKLFAAIENYFKKNQSIPETDEIVTFLISEGQTLSTNEKLYIANLTSTTLRNEIPIKRLIEDNIEIETKKIQSELNELTQTRKDKYGNEIPPILSGLDYASELQEKISNCILKHTGSISQEKSSLITLNELIYEIETGKPTDEYIPTGIKYLDAHIIGIPKRHLTIIGARPGQGKTTFALQLKRNFLEQGYKVGFISLEMDAKDLHKKDLAAITEINSLKIDERRLTAEEIQKIREAKKKLKPENFFVNDKAFQTPQQIKTIINQWKVQQNIDIVIIDYLQQIKPTYKKERYDLEIGALSNDLRIFAKETGTPIIILSQLNREVERRQYSRPVISDLKESGSIEQDAKTILLLYFPFKYGISPRSTYYKETFDLDLDNYSDSKGNKILNEEYYNIIIGKARSGRTGNVHLKFLPQYSKYEEISQFNNRYTAADITSAMQPAKSYHETDSEEFPI